MDFEKLQLYLVGIYKGKISNSKQITKELVEQIENGLNEAIKTQEISGEDLIKIKNFFIKNGNQVNKDFKKVKFSKDFGKYNKEREDKQKLYQDLAVKRCVNKSLQDCIYSNNFKMNERASYEFLMSITDDLEKADDVVNIFEEIDDTKIHPTWGISYQKVKQNIFLTQMSKVQNMINYLSKPHSEDEMNRVINENYGILKLCQEIDGDKLDNMIKDLHIDKDSPEIKNKLADMQKYKNLGTVVTKCLTYQNIYANPLSKHADYDDLSKLYKMSNITNEEVETLVDKLPEELQEKINTPIPRTLVKGLESIGKFSAVISDNKASMIIDGVPNTTVETENLCGILEWMAAKENIDLGKLEFSYKEPKKDKNGNVIKNINVEKKYNLSNELNKTEIAKEIYDLASKGEEIVIRDSNGKFIDTYKTKPELNGFPEVDPDVVDFDIEKVCTSYENKIPSMAKEKNIKFDDAQKTFDIEIGTCINEGLEKLSKMVSSINKKEKGKVKDDEINDIYEIINDCKTLEHCNNDKEILFSNLKSARTFCQAYLDAHIDSADKEMKNKCKVINNIYKSLQFVEGARERVLNCEENIQLNFRLNGKEFSKDEIEVRNTNKENYKETIRKQVFDKDPTINDKEQKVSGKVEEKKEINLDTTKQINIEDL